MLQHRDRRIHRVATLSAAIVVGASVLLVSGVAEATTPAITVTGLSITKGSTAGGTNIVITGTGFSTVDETVATSVVFGATNATTFLVLSNTQIAAKAPAGTGIVDVVVTDGTNTSAVSSADRFTYRAPITAAVPASTLLNSLGGSTATVTSSFSWGATAAAFALERVTATVGGVAASLTYIDATHAKLTAPAGTPSATATAVALIHDTIPGTADSTNAKYRAVIGSLSKTSGPLAGGGTITVTGKGFTGATSWVFGATAATCTNAAAPNADTSATCTVPASAAGGTTPGAVTVSFTPAGGIGYGTIAGASYTYTDLN